MPKPSGWSLRITDFIVPEIANVESVIEGVKWGNGLGTAPAAITYSFAGAGGARSYWASNYGDAEPNRIVPFSAREQALVNKIFSELAKYTNLKFQLVADTSSSVGEIRFARTNVSTDPDEVAHAYFPTESPEGGDVWFMNGHPWNAWPTSGAYRYAISYYHEIGHALGLKHSFGTSNSLPASLDNTSNTVMSYTDIPLSRGSDAPQNQGHYCVWDIQALQTIYGANTSYHAGNDVYGAKNLPFAYVLWDAGGVDTIKDCAAINLGAAPRYATFSIVKTNGAVANFQTVEKSIIENASAAHLGWHAIGNGRANLFVGANRPDSTAHHAASVMSGEGGNDVLIVEKVKAAPSAGASNQLSGGDGNDRLTGYIHRDKLNGGDGSDKLQGDAGADILIGGRGHDTLDGGAGADVYRYAKAAEGGDAITSFLGHDTMQFARAGFASGLAAGALPTSFFRSQSSGHDAVDSNDLFIFDRSEHSLWYDSDGIGTEAAVRIATFTDGHNLRASEIDLF